MRAFLAIDITQKEILDRISGILREIKRTGALVKPVELENIHLTLRFFGEIDENDVVEIKSVLESSLRGFKTFNMKLVGLGAFPSLGSPRVIWIGVSEGVNEVKYLVNKITPKLNRIGTHRENRPFSPHITICRVKRYNSALKSLIEKYKSEIFGTIKVSEISLKKSKLTPSGPIYTTLYSYKLEETN